MNRQFLATINSTILDCLFSPDAQLIATASADTTIKLWKTSDYSLKQTLRGHQRFEELAERVLG